MPRGTYLGTPWPNTPYYPTLSVLCRGYPCYTTSRCRPVTIESVTMHRRTGHRGDLKKINLRVRFLPLKIEFFGGLKMTIF